jgi:hypothetical protein
LSGASLRSSLRLLVKVAKNNFLQLKKISWDASVLKQSCLLEAVVRFCAL